MGERMRGPGKHAPTQAGIVRPEEGALVRRNAALADGKCPDQGFGIRKRPCSASSKDVTPLGKVRVGEGKWRKLHPACTRVAASVQSGLAVLASTVTPTPD